MGFGRVVRDAAGRVREIVEEAVATPEILALQGAELRRLLLRRRVAVDAACPMCP